MTKQLRLLTKIGTLIFGISLLLTNCQKDDGLQVLEETETKDQSTFTVSRINQSKILENKAVINKIQSIKSQKKNTQTNAQNKTVYSEELNFYINTDRATYIENLEGNYHSYTFPIYRDTDNGLLENLLLSLQQDGTYKAFIVSYDLTEQEKEDLDNGLYIDLEDRSTYTLIDNNNLPSNIMGKVYNECVTDSHSYWICGNGVVGHNADTPRDQCHASSYDYVIELEWGLCPDSGGDGSDPGTVETGNETDDPCDTCGSGGTSAGGSTGSGNPEVTSPTTDNSSPDYLRFKDFKLSELTSDQRGWLNHEDNTGVHDSVRNYLEGQLQNQDSTVTSYPQEAVQYAQEIVRAGRNGSLISASPLVKYPDDVANQYKEDYPNFTEFLKNEIIKIKNDNEVIEALTQIGILSEEDIIEALTWGEGPEIRITPLSSTNVMLGRYNPTPIGEDEANFGPNVIEINSYTVDLLEADLESNIPTYDLKTLKFFIAIVILHELTHYADFHYNGYAFQQLGVETGFLFEDNLLHDFNVYGEEIVVTIDNFEQIIQQYFLTKN